MLDGKHVGGTDDPFEFQLGRGEMGCICWREKSDRGSHGFWIKMNYRKSDQGMGYWCGHNDCG